MTSVPHVATASGGYPGIHNTKRLNQARPSAMSPRLLRAAPKVPVMAASRRTCLTVVANAASQGDAIPPPIVFNVSRSFPDCSRRFSHVNHVTPARIDGLHYFAPSCLAQTVLATAEKKAAQDLSTTLVLGFSAGALIGIGALLMSCVGASSPALASANPGLCNFLKGAVGLPAGLTLVILTGAELFTGNVMTMFSGLLAKRIDAGALLRNWLLSYAGNFIGSIVMAYLAFGAKTAAVPAAKAAVVGIATAKVSLPFGVAVCKGILCNWLVCLAVWGTMASTSVAGKVLAIFWPITAFVTLGFEHSVANMFLIPHGMLNGAQVTVKDMMLNNILPVTLGNVISAVLFVAGLHFWAYGRQK